MASHRCTERVRWLFMSFACGAPIRPIQIGNEWRLSCEAGHDLGLFPMRPSALPPRPCSDCDEERERYLERAEALIRSQGGLLEDIRHAMRHRHLPPRKGALNAGIAFIRIDKESPMQSLPLHRSLADHHAVLLLQPLDADGNPVELSTLGIPQSSDPAVSSAELRADGRGFNLLTPNESGSVHYTFTPPGFDGLEFDFTYAPPAVGHLNPSFGDDEPDA